jgi:hypothetical protein
MSIRKTTQGASDLLANLIIALLAPMFLWSSQGDVALARAAAAETLNAYCAADNLTLIRAGKILAFDLATLSSLSLSMCDETAATLALRLRGNAVSLDRAAERNRAALEQDRRNAALVPQAAEADPAAAVREAQRQVRQAPAEPQPSPPQMSPPAAPVQTTAQPAASEAGAPMTEQRRATAWAGAMTEVAAEMTAELFGLSPAERVADVMRIEALTRTATALGSGTALPPYLAASSVTAAPPLRR